MTIDVPSLVATSLSTKTDSIVLGPIHLDVTDRERGLQFWRDLIGLNVLKVYGSVVHLGVGGVELIVLHPGAVRPLNRNRTGLYHLALHLPSLSEFARVVARVHRAGHHQYPTDHLMHLADYVDDFDGIGLELVFETRERYGSLSMTADGPVLLDSDGNTNSGRDAVDINWLLEQAPDDLDAPLPAGTFLGHIHLRVANMDDTVAFYRDQIGLTTNMHVPGFDMFDMSAGGSFPHRLAGNVWESRDQPHKEADTAGMRSFSLRYRDRDDYTKALERVSHAGSHLEDRRGEMVIRDPSGITLHLSLL